jgi:hypothetical protein
MTASGMLDGLLTVEAQPLPEHDGTEHGIAIAARLDAVEIATVVYGLDRGTLDLSPPRRVPPSARPRVCSSPACGASVRMRVTVVDTTPAFLPYQAFFRHLEPDVDARPPAGAPLLDVLATHDFRAQFVLAGARPDDDGDGEDALARRYEVFDSYVRWESGRGVFEIEFGSETHAVRWRRLVGEDLTPLLWLCETTLVRLAAAPAVELSIWMGPVTYTRDALQSFPPADHGPAVATGMPPSCADAGPRREASADLGGWVAARESPRHRPHSRQSSLGPAPSDERRADDLAYDDLTWWHLVTSLSEADDLFDRQFGDRECALDFGTISNEDSAQSVIPALKAAACPGAAYVGVGPEQNFTYIAAVRPSLAFIVDIRRDNLIQHFIYKAIFEQSRDRADFLSLLFSRPRPSGLDAGTSVSDLCDAYEAIEPSPVLYESTLRAVIDQLFRTRGLPGTESDRAGIARTLQSFCLTSPRGLRGAGHATSRSYAQLMEATDAAGRQHSYLASEELFGVVRRLHTRNLIVPVVGDLAGGRTLPGIGVHLRSRGLCLGTFYVSNVERYLFDRDDRGGPFYEDVAALPLAPASVLIRTVSSSTSRRLGIRTPVGLEHWRAFLSPISETLADVAEGRLRSYRDLFAMARSAS